jgi:hypothetical protein
MQIAQGRIKLVAVLMGIHYPASNFTSKELKPTNILSLEEII